MKFKGFIGPLGDDIPSIFPIVFSVLLFTGTIIYANQLISEKAKQLEIREGALALSYLVTEKGFIEKDSSSGLTTLNKLCENKVRPLAASKGIAYLITLKRFCKGVPTDFESDEPDLNPYQGVIFAGRESSPFFVIRSPKEGSTWDYCTNDPINPPEGQLFKQKENSVVLSFPVAVPCNPEDADDDEAFTFGLGVINVIAWK